MFNLKGWYFCFHFSGVFLRRLAGWGCCFPLLVVLEYCVSFAFYIIHFVLGVYF